MSEQKNLLIEVNDLKMHFPIKRGLLKRTVGHVRAVDGVSFYIHRGETLGLVGESGCGKTTAGRSVNFIGMFLENSVDNRSATPTPPCGIGSFHWRMFAARSNCLNC